MNLTETILPMPDDYEGKVIATLLRADSTAPSDRAVLYPVAGQVSRRLLLMYG